MTKVLITGVAGGQGRLVARRLLQQPRRYRVSGIDRQSWPRHPEGLRFHQLDVRKKGTENVIRTERPDVIIHLALIRHFGTQPATRHEVNVNGTRRLLDTAVRHGVKQFIVFSSSYVYGALPENPSYMDESYPLSASRTYPEVRDLTEVDMLATAYLWQYPKMTITILRPVNVLGPHVHSAISRYLRRSYVPTLVGFNPMLQFIHEEDMAEAMVLAIQHKARGVFNVVGPGAVPLSIAIHETGGTAVPMPELLIRPVISQLFRFGLYGFPPRAIDFIKYPCTLDGSRFAAAAKFHPKHSLEEIFASVRP
jgi:UDP-glucose 4-epimerase